MMKLLNKILAGMMSAVLVMGLFEVPMNASDSTLLAFPGAEGGGKYTVGARASTSRTVYHVTNLNASGTGSFADAVSASNRIIVFDVGGTIDMKGGQIKVNGSNLTILGQTAPGDGITVTGGDLVFANGVEQIIMRYIRVRPTDKYGGEPDGIGGRWNNYVIIDHCSISWSVDEMLTLYAGSSETDTPGANLTVQNTLAAESLRMSNHFKGAHGYGAILGATYSTWYHNLLAHHDSRSPRLDRELNHTDIRNNIIYDWGQTNSAYGGEPYSYKNVTQNGIYVNYANNYYKYGPATKSTLRSRIFELSDPKDASADIAQFYFAGNYVWGYPAVTSDNSTGLKNSQYATLLTEPLSMGVYEISAEETAEQTYDTLLSDVGATLPKRDAIDARIIADVENQTGRIVNNADEVGGVIATETVTRTFEIPSDWKTSNGMSSTAKETDIVPSGDWAGYTWIEAYVNDWTEEQSAPTNPSITVTSPATQNMSSLGTNNNWAVINDNETVTYSATAAPVGDTTISKIEIYDGNSLIKTVNSASINEALTLSAGTHYLTSRAYNNKGEATQSDTSIVYVKGTNSDEEYTHAQIGTSNAFDGQGGSWVDSDGVYTVMGSGNLVSSNGQVNTGIANDSCDFMYKEVTGDFDFTVRRDQIPKFENGEVCGIMARESLDTGSRMVMLADGWLKYGENVSIISRDTENSASTVSYFKNSSSVNIQNDSTYDTSDASYTMPEYLRMQREGDTVTLSVSNDGVTWTNNPRQPEKITITDLAETLYLGIAVDSVQGTPMKEYMAEASFEIVEPEPEPEPDLESAVTFQFSTDFFGGVAKGIGPFSKTVKDINGSTDMFTITALQQVEDTTDTTNVWSCSNSYITGKANPASSSDAAAGASITVPRYGTVIKLTPYLSGSFDVIYTLNANKALKLVKAVSGSTTGTVIYAPDKSAAIITGGTLNFSAENGYDYYIYAHGSKLSYSDITFTPYLVQTTPTPAPTAAPVSTPAVNPTAVPTSTPTVNPTAVPASTPTVNPTAAPASTPTVNPTAAPASTPTVNPTAAPASTPTVNPTAVPASTPTVNPTAAPTTTPTVTPTVTPTDAPTQQPILYQVISYNRETRTAVITAPEDRTAAVIFAAYDEKGKLTGVSIKSDEELTDKTDVTADEEFDNDVTVKVFVWDTLSSMKPITMNVF